MRNVQSAILRAAARGAIKATSKRVLLGLDDAEKRVNADQAVRLLNVFNSGILIDTKIATRAAIKKAREIFSRLAR